MIPPTFSECLKKLWEKRPAVLKKGKVRARSVINVYKNRPLFQQIIFAFVVIILCPIFLIAVYSYYNGARQIKEQYRERFYQRAETINENFADALKELDWLTLQIARQNQTQYFVLQNKDNYYAKYQLQEWGANQMFLNQILADKDYIGRVSIVGDTGIEYSFYGNLAEKYDRNLYDHEAVVEKDRKYREELPTDGGCHVFVSKLKDEAKEVYLTVARRFSAGNYFHLAGTVYVEIPTLMLEKLMSNAQLNEGEVWVLNADGYIVYQTDPTRIGHKVSYYFDEELFAEAGNSFTVEMEGRKMFFGYQKHAENGWYSLVGIPVDEMQKPIQNVKNILLYTLLIAFPLTLVLGFYFTRSILEPIHQLEWYMDRMWQEKWEKVIGEIPDNEIGTLMRRYNQMVDEIQNLIEEVYKAQLQQSQDKLEKRNAQLQALQTQINPHFLYNTLGAINTYALEADQREIEQMVNALGQMLRYAVQNPLEPVKVYDEMNHVENYLKIMQYRHRRMPEIIWEIDEEIEQKILRLTIQPLVENAFQHAFEAGISEGHFIRIAVHYEDGLIVEVEDNGSGIAKMQPGKIYGITDLTDIKFGIGLTNVDKRLRLIYGETAGVYFLCGSAGGIIVRLKLPDIHWR